MKKTLVRGAAGVGMQEVVEFCMRGRDREQKQQSGEGGTEEFRPN
ncbi:MAG: hypothetical protein M5U12_29610 [Verrucomicrobia bacterium]|nr:hypothetical protein [Verrucomicrobiota bacterium]